VCKLLFEAGLFHHSQAWVSGVLASHYGKPGRGRLFTVWANGGHVFIQFHGTKQVHFFDTSRQAGGGSGPRLRYGSRSTSGFTPRHYPGL
jgi:hypothetical protein